MASTQQIAQAPSVVPSLCTGHLLVSDSSRPGIAGIGPALRMADYAAAETNQRRVPRPMSACDPREPVGPVPRPGVPFRAVSMFTDIRESTSMTHRLGVSRMLRLLKDFFGEAESRIKDHEGSTRNYNGDGGLALFCGRDRADRALAAALSIQRFTQVFAVTVPEYEPHRLNDAGHLSFAVGIGMDDGEVAMELIGDKPGPEVWAGAGMAAKLAGEARPGSIVMTDEMFTGTIHGTAEDSVGWIQAEDRLFGGVMRRIHVIGAQQTSLTPAAGKP